MPPSLLVAPAALEGREVKREAAGKLPPVVLVGGAINGLSVARSLGRRGIKVYAINPPGEHICYSRYCTWLPESVTGKGDEAWAEYLLGPQSDWLAGSVLLACNDAGVQMLAIHRNELQKKFLLDDCHPPAQLCMLDKLSTYQAAVEAGVATPRFWVVRSREQVLALRDELVYPLLVKPLLSHVYRKRFGTKFATAHDFAQVLDGYAQAEAAGIDVMLVEKIPGPDDRLCSYYTYLDAEGNALFDFTKRVIRRYPITSGLGCYHITDWIPELKEPALKLFRHVGLRGLGNVEFKLDERDGCMKLIECNARFTGGNPLLADSGYDLALFVYNRMVGRPQEPFRPQAVGKRLWYPIEDFHAYRELSRRGELTLGQWLKSIAHPVTFPYFRWSDPWPTVRCEMRRLWQAVSRRLGRRQTPAKAAPATQSPEAGLRFVLVSDRQELERLAPAWSDLLARSSANEPMLSPEWLLPWWDIYGGGRNRTLSVGLFYDGDRLVGLAPLQRRYHRFRLAMPYLELEPLGASTGKPDDVCSEYLGIVAEQGREKEVAVGFVAALKEGQFGRWHALNMPMADGTSPMRDLLRKALGATGLKVEERVQTEAPYIPLPATWDDYLRALGKHRRFLVKSLRDFEAWAGGEAVYHTARTAEQLAHGRQVLRQLHTERWQAADQPGVFQADRFTQFHDRVMATLFAKDALELHWLTVRGQPIAALYSIRWNGKIYFYQSGRSLDVPDNIRPGIILHAHCIQQAIEAGLREYDFLGGATQYKRQLSLASRELVETRAAPRGFRETVRQLFLRGRRLLGRLYRLCKRSPASR